MIQTYGIIGAMKVETELLVEHMQQARRTRFASMDFFEGVLCGKQVVVVQSGIGKVNAGICAQILCNIYHVDAIINTGIAGALDLRLTVGDVVVSTEVVHHDFDVSNLSYPLGQIPGMDTLTFKASDELIVAADKAIRSARPDIHCYMGCIASGDQFVHTSDRKTEIVQAFGALCCEMEGAAIGQTCYLNHIPFVVMRTISDNADEESGVDYPKFEKQTAHDNARIIEHMLLTL